MADAQVAEERQPTGLEGWMKSIGNIDEVFTPPAPDPEKALATPAAPAKEEGAPNAGKTNDGQAAGSPAADAGNAAAAAAGKAPDAGAKPADAGAAPGAKPAEAAKPEEGEEQWPRTSPDWEKFKAKRKEREEALKKDISTREATITELQTAKKALEDQIATAATTGKDPELDRLKQENQLLTERLMATDVTQDPRFVTYFENKTNAQLELAKRVVGADKAEELVKALKMPDSEELREIKEATIEEIVGNLNPLQQSRIGAVLNNLEEIKAERESEIKKAGDFRDKSKAKDEETRASAVKNMEKVFNDTLAKIQDEKNGSPLFREKPGDAEWNKSVQQRIGVAKTLLSGKGMKTEDVINAAFTAVAYPSLLVSYREDMKTKDAEISKLQEQVKALSAAQPGKGTTGEGANGAEPQGLVLKPGMSPSEATAAFARSVAGGSSRE
jgi:hypothetical protein